MASKKPQHDTAAPRPSHRELLLEQAKLTLSFTPLAQRHVVYKLAREGFRSRACSPAEILDAAYGAQGEKYWDLWLFEPLRIYEFAELLALHNAAPNVLVLDGDLRQIFQRLQAAAEAGETWFIGDVSPLLIEEWASAKLHNSALAVRPKEAIAWMLRNPNARHLVPTMPAMMIGGPPERVTTPEPITHTLPTTEHIVPEFGTNSLVAGGATGRPLVEKRAQIFAQQYCAEEKRAGREPTQSGLEKAAHKEGWRGGRNYLRGEFHKLQVKTGVQVRRGRPKNSPK